MQTARMATEAQWSLNHLLTVTISNHFHAVKLRLEWEQSAYHYLPSLVHDVGPWS
jgi:hypothetical protein